MGALAGLIAAVLAHLYLGWASSHFLFLIILCLWPAIWASGRYAQDRNLKDPGPIVIDEVLGQWLTLTGATALNTISWPLAFVLFRLFDIWKPFPVRQLENLPGGTGIVADDLGAGLWAALVLWLAGWFNLY